METTLEQDTITGKTLELCQAILDQPEIQAKRADVETFLADEKSQKQYRDLVELSEFLNHQQSHGNPITDEQKANFEKEREALLQNPTAKSFLDAQQEMQKVQQTIHEYVSKTLELGRIPTEEDFSSGDCCGDSGCGCSH